MWNKFSETMPDCGRPIMLAFTERDDDSRASAHLTFAYAEKTSVGFNEVVSLYKTDWIMETSEQYSPAMHNLFFASAKWAYVADLLRASELAALAPEPNVYTNADQPFAGNLKGEVQKW